MPWHAREEITTWKLMGAMTQTRKLFLGLQDQHSTSVTVRRAVKSDDKYYLSNCWLQFWDIRVTEHCYAIEEGTGQHKVNVSLGLKCAHLPGSTSFQQVKGRKKKKAPISP